METFDKLQKYMKTFRAQFEPELEKYLDNKLPRSKLRGIRRLVTQHLTTIATW